MSGQLRRPGGQPPRFPGLDTAAHADTWDQATASVVLGRLGRQPEVRFFTRLEEGIAHALFCRLLALEDDSGIPVVQMVDGRLAEDQIDGWRYHDMPPDRIAWQQSLAALERDALDEHQRGFAACSVTEQQVILATVQGLGAQQWHDLNAAHVWNMWGRYATTAFYSHPWAWDEIGFSGPAYPRGYKNLGVDKLEGFEVRDAEPHEDPERGKGGSR